MELRKWQSEALAQIDAWDGTPAIIRAVMGAGKSIVIAEVVKRYKPTGNVVIAAPSIALVSQLLEDIDDAVAYFTHDKRVGPVTVTTYNSLAAVSERLEGCELLICDEAHQTQNERAILAIKALNPNRLLGFTATDWRAEKNDGLSLFDVRLYNYGVAEAMRDGVVVPFRVHLPLEDDPDDVDGAALAMAHRAIEHGPTIVNATSIDDADMFAERLRKNGIAAETIHSQRKDKDKVLMALFRGELRAVVHVEMLREGVNLPWLRALVIRRIRSRVGFPQEVGRVLRAYPGKTEAHIYDALDAFGQLGLDYESCLGQGTVDEDDNGECQAPEPIRRALRHFKRDNKAHHTYTKNTLTLKVTQWGKTPEDDWAMLAKACDQHQWTLRMHKPKNAESPPAVKADAALRLIRELAIAWRSCGGIAEMQARGWRGALPTEKQVASLGRMRWTTKVIKGAEDKELWGLVLEEAAKGQYDRGTTSDVWSILRAAEAHGWHLWPTN